VFIVLKITFTAIRCRRGNMLSRRAIVDYGNRRIRLRGAGMAAIVMTEALEAGLLFLILLGSAAVGLFIRPFLSEAHRGRETTDSSSLSSLCW
jgi:hypothetical protein